MHGKRSLTIALGVCAGLTAWSLATAAEVAAKPTVTVVKVTAGAPAELQFALSRFSKLPAGTITFEVRNAGVSSHDFKLCTSPLSSTALVKRGMSSAALKNSCAGGATKILRPGQTATLTVKLTKSGQYEYLCTVPGHAAAGMKGLIGIGVKVTPAAPTAAVTTTTPTATTPAAMADPATPAPTTDAPAPGSPPADAGAMFGRGGGT